ncbi:sulfotransferase family protein [Paracoccus aminophilus]|uniref:Sulfotransferase family protein n=1 Tax=Paracoccus aminophilus JCM 7686 TaxID=1367847 RepID=S5XU94_PARAH|nr:sulfotransferase family protein [Paracoccus aminophilus]AGT08772.1 hypothetical protein JCM7686_1671 [Paracoccus aminophilus JCM 7686]
MPNNVSEDAAASQNSTEEDFAQRSCQEVRASPRNCLLVLGMHRSGTSALSGLFCLAGCTPPKTPIPAGDENPKSFFESSLIVEVNDALLAAAGSNWHDWTALKVGRLDAVQESTLRTRALDTLSEEFGTSSFFVFKDPRICRFAAFWLEVLRDANYCPNIVHIHRNPLEVAASLAKRNGFSKELGLLLWLRHVLDAEVTTRGQSRDFVSYAGLLENPARLVSQVRVRLGSLWSQEFKVADSELNEFISPELRHFSEPTELRLSDPEISPWVQKTFDIMENWAAEGENSRDYLKLDAIRTALNDAEPMFEGLVKNAQSAAEANRKMSLEIALAKKEVESCQKEIAENLKKTVAIKAVAAAVSAASAKDQTKLEAIRAALAITKLELVAAQGKVQDREKDLDRLTEIMDVAKQDQELLLTRVIVAEANRDALLKSRSWRVTGPLRRIADHLRRAKRKRLS